jgi:hypothetical protein
MVHPGIDTASNPESSPPILGATQLVKIWIRQFQVKETQGTTTEQAKLWNRSNEILEMSGFTRGKNAGSSIPVPWQISQWQSMPRR